MQAAKLDEQSENRVRALITNKNFYGVEEFLESKDISADLLEIFTMLGKMYNCPNEWQEFLDKAKNYPQIYNALKYLEDLYDILEIYGVSKYISFELGMVSPYQYYTGILFGGYTYGSGEPIVRGGRYDDLLSYYGKEAPAIGFAIYIDQLLMAMERQKINIFQDENPEVLLYTSNKLKEAVATTNEMRNAGKDVTMVRVSSKEAAVKIQQDYPETCFTILD